MFKVPANTHRLLITVQTHTVKPNFIALVSALSHTSLFTSLKYTASPRTHLPHADIAFDMSIVDNRGKTNNSSNAISKKHVASPCGQVTLHTNLS
jgi:stress response protein SCP2